MLLWILDRFYILQNEFEMGLEEGPLRDMQYNTTRYRYKCFRHFVNFVIRIDVIKQNKIGHVFFFKGEMS